MSWITRLFKDDQPPNRPPRKPTQTLSQFLFPVIGESRINAIEQYRIAYEKIHGPTDLTKRYTSLWPDEQMEWLAEHEPKRYFDGLPPFVKALLKEKIQVAADTGKLDDIPEPFFQLFLRGQMSLDSESRGR